MKSRPRKKQKQTASQRIAKLERKIIALQKAVKLAQMHADSARNHSRENGRVVVAHTSTLASHAERIYRCEKRIVDPGRLALAAKLAALDAPDPIQNGQSILG